MVIPITGRITDTIAGIAPGIMTAGTIAGGTALTITVHITAMTIITATTGGTTTAAITPHHPTGTAHITTAVFLPGRLMGIAAGHREIIAQARGKPIMTRDTEPEVPHLLPVRSEVLRVIPGTKH